MSITSAGSSSTLQAVDAVEPAVVPTDVSDRAEVSGEDSAQHLEQPVNEAQQSDPAEESTAELPAVSTTSIPQQGSTETTGQHVRFGDEEGPADLESSAPSIDKQAVTSLQDNRNDSDDDTAPEPVTAKDKTAMPEMLTTPRRPRRRQTKEQRSGLTPSVTAMSLAQAVDHADSSELQKHIMDSPSDSQANQASIPLEDISSPLNESLFTIESSGDPDFLTHQQRRALLPSLPPKSTGSFARYQTGKTGHRKTQLNWAGRDSFLKRVKA